MPSSPQSSASARSWATRINLRSPILLAGTLVAALSFGFTLWLATRFMGRTVTARVDDIGETAAALVAAAGCAYAAWRHTRARRRWAWALFSVSAFSWGMGQAVWSWYEIHLGVTVPFPSLADLGYLAACPTAAAAVLLLPDERLTARWSIRLMLDGLIVATALLTISWTLVMRAVSSAGGTSPVAQAISLGYPISDVVIGAMLFVTVMRTGRGSRATVWLVISGLATLALADSSFTYYTANNTYDTGNVLDAGWFTGYLLIGLAGLRSVVRPGSLAVTPASPSRTMMLLPYIPVGAATLVDAYAISVRHQLDAVTVVSTALLVAMVLVRQFVTLAENGDLLRRVADREADLHHQAHHDALTGLPNRVLLQRQGLAALGRASPSCAVLFIDLDDFKRVNDSFGHSTGDQFLVAVADRLNSLVRPGDTAARLGGDEFAVLLPGVSTRSADDVAERLIAALEQPLVIGAECLRATATVGIAVSTDSEPVGWEELMRRADVAMYAAKSRGKCLSVRYTPALDDVNAGPSGWQSDLERALDDGQFLLHYQPIINTEMGSTVATEALLRWQHPDRGLLAPSDFLGHLEDTDAIIQVGAWVLQEACRQCVDWRAVTGRELRIHVNVSTRQLQRASFPGVVRAALEGSGLPGSALVLELTESALLLDSASAAARLRAIKRLDVEIALDDFGTGFSSLTHLRQLPVDMLKVDKSFIDELGHDPDRTSIAEALVRLSESLGKSTVAEGVETEGQARLLREVGCPMAQGFHYGRPAPADVITSRLLTHSAATRVRIVS